MVETQTVSVASTLSQFGLTIIGGAIGAWITMHFGWRQFRSQRWWDKKADAYLALVDTFHPLLDEDGEYWNAIETDQKIGALKQKELRDKAKAAEAAIHKQLRLSSFLIDEEARDAILKMFKQLDAAAETTDWVQYRDSTSFALWAGLDAVKRIAMSDLGIGERAIFMRRFKYSFARRWTA